MHEQKMIDKFTEVIRETVKESAELTQELERKLKVATNEVASVRQQNKSLREKLVAFYDGELSKSELYLIAKIDRLEKEVRELEVYINSLTKKPSVEN